jgi:hypothetical protein
MDRLAERIGLFEVATAVAGKLVWSTVEKPHWELEADGTVYVLLPDTADRVAAAFLRAHEGRYTHRKSWKVYWR